MFGYLRPFEDELKVKEAKLYRAVYCGICRSIKLRMGELARPALSYDAVLPAILWMSLQEQEGRLEFRRCMMHPQKSRPVAVHAAIDTAADLCVCLAGAKLEDDILDERRMDRQAAYALLKKAYVRSKSNLPSSAVEEMDQAMFDLLRLETGHCDQLDAMADCSGRLLRAGFLAFSDIPQEAKENVGWIGYFTGRWVYLADCIDDYDRDLKKHRYNVLLCSEKDKEEMISLARDACDYAASQALACLRQLPLKHYGGILENYYLGGLPYQLSLLPHKERNHG